MQDYTMVDQLKTGPSNSGLELSQHIYQLLPY